MNLTRISYDRDYYDIIHSVHFSINDTNMVATENCEVGATLNGRY